MSRRTLSWSDAQHQELLHVRDHDQRPYLRERAAALLKIADGATLNEVARRRLLQPRQQRTGAAWVDRYEDQGLPGLLMQPRGHRGFSP
jgi:hypothetical protein